MDRRTFLKAVAAVPLAATLPPLQAHRAQYQALTYEGLRDLHRLCVPHGRMIVTTATFAWRDRD